jgi:hypothetical protein
MFRSGGPGSSPWETLKALNAELATWETLAQVRHLKDLLRGKRLTAAVLQGALQGEGVMRRRPGGAPGNLQPGWRSTAYVRKIPT